MKGKWIKPALLVLALVVVLVFAFWLQAGLVRFWPFTAGEFVQLITPLFLIALFIERALEVFLTAWRGPEAAVRQASAALQGVPPSDDTSVVEYKSGTQRIAFAGGLLVGIIISALGIRALGMFVDPAAFGELPRWQQRAFNIMDVLLTGAVLGGGADALHKLVSVFTNFMDSTAKRAKGEAPPVAARERIPLGGQKQRVRSEESVG